MRTSIFLQLLPTLLVGIAFFFPQTASRPSALASTLISSGREQLNKLAKRKWTFLSYKQPFAGNEDATLIPPWYILYNMIYNRKKTIGLEETVLYGTNGTTVHWGNYLKIAKVDSTSNVPKSYSFLGMTSDLNNRIKDYSSIPASYKWSRRNRKAGFKGNVCFDFVVSNGPNKKSDHELMLWLEWEGGQGPIGTGDATMRIKNLYGQDWTLYQGMNTDINVPVRSLVPDTPYKNFFAGDMKDWLMKLVEAKIFRDDAYLFTANLGMEAFWGESIFSAHSSLQLLWDGNHHQSGYMPPSYQTPTPGSVVPGYENTR
ncbi:family 12 glycoside hydrolase [Melampsora larici-populina 98AG31]|uniref:Family 12 glycoside hydrolase n=1 Tax=Melampsora larici-populina (strain 98AG31 / pathotype 3-4-7) TaxID=747676 RepID=F4RSL3_MELLP|nr:family 12 glycoside hydrolase [Melampsora larici-populina 98AG31]EGG04673.1 family 12 glycoside hydrolase [Melampsora larici-populina 98AG31]